VASAGPYTNHLHLAADMPVPHHSVFTTQLTVTIARVIVMYINIVYCFRTRQRRSRLSTETACCLAVVATWSPASSEVWPYSRCQGLHSVDIQTSLTWTVSGRRNHWTRDFVQVQLRALFILSPEGYQFLFYFLFLVCSFLLPVLFLWSINHAVFQELPTYQSQ